MQSNNTFDLTRFGALCRQQAAHQYKFALTALVAYAGGLFILLLVMQIFDRFEPLSPKRFETLFLVTIIPTAILWAGAAFPGLRSRQKALSYLLVPASVLEKFLIEVLGRIVLFMAVVPLVYFLVYNIEAYTVNMFYSGFGFQGQSPWDFPFATEAVREGFAVLLLTASLLLLFVLPLTGATVFSKNPLVKTLFAVALIFFFNLFLIYFFLEVLGFNQYSMEQPPLFIRDSEDAILTLTVVSTIFTVGFLAAAYLKLTEQEV